jgi:hypothetical protein
VRVEPDHRRLGAANPGERAQSAVAVARQHQREGALGARLAHQCGELARQVEGRADLSREGVARPQLRLRHGVAPLFQGRHDAAREQV